MRVEQAVLKRLRAMRKPGESYSDILVRLVELEAKGAALSSGKRKREPVVSPALQ